MGAGGGRLSLAWLRRAPWWVTVVAASLAARLLSLALLVAVARWAPAPAGRVAPIPVLTELSLWDGGWYQQIVAHGYPASLPRAQDGSIGFSAWAFYPAYPVTIAALSRVSGLPVAAVSAVLNPLLGTVAALLLYRLVADGLAAHTDGHGDHPRALRAVVLWCVAPTAVVLQLLYSEALAAVVVLAGLLLIRRRRYLGACVPVLVLGVTRPLGAAMALTVVVLLTLAWRASGWPKGRERVAQATLVASCLVAVPAWPFVVDRLTGVPGAYLATMRAWRPGVPLTAFEPWWLVAHRHAPLVPAVLGLVVLACAAALPVLVGPGRLLPLELRVWTLACLGYVAAVVAPTTSVARYLLLAFGIWTAMGLARTRVAVAWGVACLALQVCWVVMVWHGVGSWALPP